MARGAGGAIVTERLLRSRSKVTGWLTQLPSAAFTATARFSGCSNSSSVSENVSVTGLVATTSVETLTAASSAPTGLAIGWSVTVEPTGSAAAGTLTIASPAGSATLAPSRVICCRTAGPTAGSSSVTTGSSSSVEPWASSAAARDPVAVSRYVYAVDLARPASK